MMIGAAKPEQTSVNEGRSKAIIDTLLAQLGSYAVLQRGGLVYFIRRGDEVKIGFTRNISQRIKNLQNGPDDDLTLLGMVHGSYDTEQEYHARFRHLRTHGEWFKADPDLLAAIAEDSQEQPTPTYKQISDVFCKNTRKGVKPGGNSGLIYAQTNVGFWLKMLVSGETEERLTGLEHAVKNLERARSS